MYEFHADDYRLYFPTLPLCVCMFAFFLSIIFVKSFSHFERKFLQMMQGYEPTTRAHKHPRNMRAHTDTKRFMACN